MKTWRRPYFERVLALLGGDVGKAHAWYVVGNPIWNHETPEELIERGRERAVLRMVEQAEQAEARAQGARQAASGDTK